MLRKGVTFFILINLCVDYDEALPLGITNPQEIFDFVKQIFCTYNEVKDEVKTWKDAFGVAVNFLESVRNQQKKLLDRLANKLNSLSEEVHAFHDVVGTKLNRVEALLNRLPAVLLQSNLQNDIAKSIRFIHKQHKLFLEYTSSKNFNNKTLRAFSESVTDPGADGIRSHLDTISYTVVPSSEVPVGDTVLGLIDKNAPKPEADDCIYARSPQQSVFDLYNILISTELLGFVVLTYGYSLQTLFHGVSVEQEMNSTEQAVLDRYAKYHSAFTATMKSMPRSFGACEFGDIKHTRDDTYIELTDLLRGIVVADFDLVEDGSCAGGCEKIDTKNVDKCYTKGDSVGSAEAVPWEKCSNPKPCGGRIHNCTTLTDAKICMSTEGTKRYEWFLSKAGVEYGHSYDRRCKSSIKEFNSWWRILSLEACEYCACVCDNTVENSKNPQIISFLAARSDTENNKIVTGLRFKRQDSALHIQIKEGALGANGYIEPTSEKWVPVVNFKNYIHQINDGKPYFTIIHEANNALFLDDVVVPFGWCVTGVRFGYSSTNGDGIAVFIQSTAFDYKTGQLTKDSSEWTSQSYAKLQKLSLDDLDSPLLSVGPDIEDSKPKQFVKFTISSWTKNAGQSTVPFFDARKVETKPSTPLSGVGLFHRGFKGYGGFLAFKMFSLDYHQLLKRGKLPDEVKKTISKG